MSRAFGYALGYGMSTLLIAVILLSLGATVLYGDPARFPTHAQYETYKSGVNSAALVFACLLALGAALIGAGKGRDEDERLNRPRV